MWTLRVSSLSHVLVGVIPSVHACVHLHMRYNSRLLIQARYKPSALAIGDAMLCLQACAECAARHYARHKA